MKILSYSSQAFENQKKKMCAILQGTKKTICILTLDMQVRMDGNTVIQCDTARLHREVKKKKNKLLAQGRGTPILLTKVEHQPVKTKRKKSVSRQVFFLVFV